MLEDGAKTAQDALSGDESGKTSDDKSKQTSKKAKDEVLTPEAKAKLISDAKAEEGRKWKQVELERDQLKGQVGTLTDRLDTIESRQSAVALEEAGKDPTGTALARVQAEAALRKRENEVQGRENTVARGEAQLKADQEAFTSESGETIVATIATKHGVDPAKLAAYGITNKDTLEKIAADLAVAKPADKTVPETELTDEQRAEAQEAVFTPTSDTPSGGKPVELTAESIENADMAELEQVVAPKIK